MEEVTQAEMVLVSEAAIRLRLNREQVIRRIQTGEIAGGRAMGVWYVLRTALEKLIAGAQACKIDISRCWRFAVDARIIAGYGPVPSVQKGIERRPCSKTVAFIFAFKRAR